MSSGRVPGTPSEFRGHLTYLLGLALEFRGHLTYLLGLALVFVALAVGLAHLQFV